MYNENEKPLGMSDEEWDEFLKSSLWLSCPQEVKDAFYKQNGFQLSDAEHDEIWQEMPDYLAQLKEEHSKKKFVYMYTPNGMEKIQKCMNIIKKMSDYLDEPIVVKAQPIDTILMVNEYETQILSFRISEIKFGTDVVDGKCGTLLSDLNETASLVSLAVANNGIDISVDVYINDAVVVKEV